MDTLGRYVFLVSSNFISACLDFISNLSSDYDQKIGKKAADDAESKFREKLKREENERQENEKRDAQRAAEIRDKLNREREDQAKIEREVGRSERRYEKRYHPEFREIPVLVHRPPRGSYHSDSGYEGSKATSSLGVNESESDVFGTRDGDDFQHGDQLKVNVSVGRAREERSTVYMYK